MVRRLRPVLEGVLRFVEFVGWGMLAGHPAAGRDTCRRLGFVVLFMLFVMWYLELQ